MSSCSLSKSDVAFRVLNILTESAPWVNPLKNIITGNHTRATDIVNDITAILADPAIGILDPADRTSILNLVAQLNSTISILDALESRTDLISGIRAPDLASGELGLTAGLAVAEMGLRMAGTTGSPIAGFNIESVFGSVLGGLDLDLEGTTIILDEVTGLLSSLDGPLAVANSLALFANSPNASRLKGLLDTIESTLGLEETAFSGVIEIVNIFSEASQLAQSISSDPCGGVSAILNRVGGDELKRQFNF